MEEKIEACAPVAAAINYDTMSDVDGSSNRVKDDDSDETDGTDDEGLKKHYDTIIVGTGLVESILACAISKCGKSVLHLDTNDYYGGNQASFQLDSFHQWIKAHTFSASGATTTTTTSGDATEDADGDTYKLYFAYDRDNKSNSLIKVVSSSDDLQSIDRIDTKAALPSYHRKTSSNYHPSCHNYIMDRYSLNTYTTTCTTDTTNDTTTTATTAASASSSIIHPSFIGYRCNHEVTLSRALTKSNQFNIDISSSMLYGASSAVDCLLNSDVAKYMDFKSLDSLHYMSAIDRISPVPCSKSDVFNTKTLSAIEKRSLMKFMQLTMDYCNQIKHGADVATINECSLAQGRALFRPQNKEPVQQSSASINIDEYKSRSFNDFLAYNKITGTLASMITYALCLCSENDKDKLPTADGLDQLYTHINSLGRFGDTAFLCPVYGSGEISQAFCRMSAVWGATYVLRRAVKSLVLSTHTTADATPAAAVGRRKVVSGIIDTNSKCISCTSLICNVDYLSEIPSFDRCLYTRVCFVDEAILTNVARGVLVIPPAVPGIDNVNSIFIQQSDSSLSTTIDRTYIIHINTVVDIDTPIASRTQWDKYSCEEKHCDSVVDTLMRKLCTHKQINAIMYASYVQPIYTRSTSCTAIDGCRISLDGVDVPDNVEVVGDYSYDMHMDRHFEQARSVFTKLYPHEAFLPVSEAVAGDDSGDDGYDNEEQHLQSALDAINQSNTSTGTAME